VLVVVSVLCWVVGPASEKQCDSEEEATFRSENGDDVLANETMFLRTKAERRNDALVRGEHMVQGDANL
jgi:hypothetical protein